MPGEIINYNSVPLQIINQKEISRTHLYSEDRTTYECTRWVFDVKTLLNPAALSYIQNAITNTPGAFAGLTDTVIRQLLNVPRRQLIFVQNGVNVLICPTPGFTCDARNGPIVEEFDLIRDTGMKTWFVFIRLVCHVRECPPILKQGATLNYYTVGGQQFVSPYTAIGGGASTLDPTGALISNRWSRRMVTDEDYLSYVETTGECIFDAAWLQSAGVFPDQFRIDLFQPLPPNCKRDHIDVIQLADGFTYRYSFRDQERHFNTLPATRIECYQTEGFSQMNQESAVAKALIGSVRQTASAIMGVQTPLAIAGLGIGTAASLGFNTVLYQVPKFHSHILVRAWGHRGQDKMDLLNQAASMAFERIQTTRIVELIVTFDRAGKYVQVELTNKSGQEEIIPLATYYANFVPKAIDAANSIPIVRTLSDGIAQVIESTLAFFQNRPAVNVSTILPNNPPVVKFPGINENINRVFANLNTGEDSPQLWYGQDETEIVNAYIQEAEATNEDVAFTYYGNNQPPFDNYTRGTILCNLIAQSLHDPCQRPPCPPKVYSSFDGSPIIYPPIRTCQPTAAPVSIDFPEPPPLQFSPIVPGGPQENQLAQPPDAAQRVPPIENVQQILDRAQADLNAILNP